MTEPFLQECLDLSIPQYTNLQALAVFTSREVKDGNENEVKRVGPEVAFELQLDHSTEVLKARCRMNVLQRCVR